MLSLKVNSSNVIPKRIFIVPYRNRHQQKFFFSNYMTQVILQGHDDYEIYFSHQDDIRNFNRGGTKNIGFLAMKEKYPNDYAGITFIFNDVDTMPFANIFSYQTEFGIVKHYYGFRETLGGIVVIKGSDFEKINGFPNFWGWGNEDNTLQTRCNKHHLIVDRSQFCPIGSPNILQLFDGISRLINKKDPWRAKYDKGIDGLQTINNLRFTIDKQSTNTIDNRFPFAHERILFINISSFDTLLPETEDDYFAYDLREPARKIIHPNKLEMVISSSQNNTQSIKNQRNQQLAIQARINDWTYIPPNPKQNTPDGKSLIQDHQEMIHHIQTMTSEMNVIQTPVNPKLVHGNHGQQINNHHQQQNIYQLQKPKQMQDQKKLVLKTPAQLIKEKEKNISSQGNSTGEQREKSIQEFLYEQYHRQIQSNYRKKNKGRLSFF